MILFTYVIQLIQGGPNKRLSLRVDNFATVNGRKAYDRPMSKVSEFCLEKKV